MAQDGTAGGVNVGGSQGVQVGRDNTQINTWTTKTPIDPAVLSGLSAHAAVARILQAPHDEQVDLFAKASLEEVAEVLEVLQATDEDLVIAILADINPRKATELISSLGASTKWWLDALPDGAEAINHKAAALKWTSPGSLERARYPWRRGGLNAYGNPRIHLAFKRMYEKGRIVWTHEWGARAVSGAIEEYHRNDHSYSGLGVPIDDQKYSRSPFGTNGFHQVFEVCTIHSSKHGVYPVRGSIIKHYTDAGGSTGWLGFPTGEAEDNVGSGWIQRFEGGAIRSGPRSAQLPLRLLS